VAERPADDSVSELTTEVIERNRQRFNIDETKPRTFELAVVTPDGQELNSFELAEEEIWDLEGFFKDNQLPDGHYRIYLVQKNTRRLLVDAYLRDGHLIDPGEESGGNFDRPPEMSDDKVKVSAGTSEQSDQSLTSEPEMPRDFYVFDDDRPRHDEQLVAAYQGANNADPTLVTPIDVTALTDTDQNADELATWPDPQKATLVAAMATGIIGAGWIVARRALRATATATSHPQTFGRGARLMRLVRRRSLESCST
jgi:hypothetical protein